MEDVPSIASALDTTRKIYLPHNGQHGNYTFHVVANTDDSPFMNASALDTTRTICLPYSAATLLASAADCLSNRDPNSATQSPNYKVGDGCNDAHMVCVPHVLCSSQNGCLNIRQDGHKQHPSRRTPVTSVKTGTNNIRLDGHKKHPSRRTYAASVKTDAITSVKTDAITSVKTDATTSVKTGTNNISKDGRHSIR
ncbi:hypothetical protein EDB86DRAFT_2828268 [Lactarius hatsudake]|nr:hypothetical protein EDB86DRAFT_2828268 [Lactarius hatsudake]